MDLLKKISVYLALGLITEVSAYPKPGNVSKNYSFIDTTYEDFLVSSHVAQWIIYEGLVLGYENKFIIGKLIYDMVKYSKEIHGGGNTCLGTSIMIVPLALAIGKIVRENKDFKDIDLVTKEATNIVKNFSGIEDTIYLYKAIRIVSPSYIRKSDKFDLPNVLDEDFEERIKREKITLWKILTYSANYDIVCREVISNYEVTRRTLKDLEQNLAKFCDWNLALISTFVDLASSEIDTLIVRKFGLDVALKFKFEMEKIREVKDKGHIDELIVKLSQLDEYCRSRGINPGSLADILAITTSLFNLKCQTSITRFRRGNVCYEF